MESNVEWSFEKPTEEGYYMINSGDVVTQNNMEPVHIFHKDNVFFVKSFSGEIYELSKIHNSYKYLNISQLSKNLDP